MSGIGKQVRRALRRVAMSGFATLLSLAGLGFLTVSASLFLLTVTDAITTFAILGCAYVGAGLLLFVGASRTQEETARAQARSTDSQKDTTESLVAAFMHGMSEGRDAAARHK